jgi:hypothetical protein
MTDLNASNSPILVEASPFLYSKQYKKLIERSSKHTNHAFHLIMTMITCGAWIPIWILVWLFKR